MDYVTTATDRGLTCVAVFCDISRAFDSVPHSRLLAKLERQGIGGRPLELIRSYLSNRMQVFRHRATVSSPSPVHCDVPQGTPTALWRRAST